MATTSFSDAFDVVVGDGPGISAPAGQSEFKVTGNGWYGQEEYVSSLFDDLSAANNGYTVNYYKDTHNTSYNSNIYNQDLIVHASAPYPSNQGINFLKSYIDTGGTLVISGEANSSSYPHFSESNSIVNSVLRDIVNLLASI